MSVKDEFIIGFTKILGAAWTWACLILVGLVGMLGHNLYLGRKLSFWQSVGSVLVSVFVGIITSIICHMNDWISVGAVAVPVMTLVADKVMMAIISFNWQGNIKQLLKDWISKWK